MIKHRKTERAFVQIRRSVRGVSDGNNCLLQSYLFSYSGVHILDVLLFKTIKSLCVQPKHKHGATSEISPNLPTRVNKLKITFKKKLIVSNAFLCKLKSFEF